MEMSLKDKVTVFLQTRAVVIIVGLVAFIGYLVIKMRKRNVKIFGR